MPKIFSIVALLLILYPTWSFAMEKTYYYMTSANGYSAIVYDEVSRRISGFYPHIYKNYDKNTEVRNIAYDTYFGIRVGSMGFWLPERDEAVTELGYLSKSGIIHSQRVIQNLMIDEYYFSPMSLNSSGMVMLIRVKTLESIKDLSILSLHNFHLGLSDKGVDFNSERILYHPSDMFIETSSSSNYAVAYKPIVKKAIHSTNPVNPYIALKSGNRLTDVDDSGVIDDAVCGFEMEYGDLSAGEERWFGVLILYRDDKDIDSLVSTAESFIGGRGLEDILNGEREYWEEYFNLLDGRFVSMAEEDSLLYTSAVFLKMAQVREENTDKRRPYGQILASLPPGRWNITWLRDMAYSIFALIDIGAKREAINAINFVLNADTGYFRDYIGRDYKFSVCRYYGDGMEESDINEDGPNIEFDGPGLFLIALAKYIERFGSLDLKGYREIIYNGFADVLVSLIDEYGLIKKDSSIWERHLNGKEKHFTYTQITALVGLCAASRIAEDFKDYERSKGYMEAYSTLKKSLFEKLVHKEGFLVSSLEEFEAYAGYLDASVVEAINLGLVEPEGRIATSTLNILKNLRTVGGGYKRNDDGEWYDRQEWVFIDLRIADAYNRGSGPDASKALIGRVRDYTIANNYQFPELITEDGRAVAGSIPMIGFGAGAYILSKMSTNFINCEVVSERDGGIDVAEEMESQDTTLETMNMTDADAIPYIDTDQPDEDSLGDLYDREGSSTGCGCSLIDFR